MLVARARREPVRRTLGAILRGDTPIAQVTFGWMLLLVLCVGGALFALSGAYHVFGTDATGNDVLYQTFKAMRIALLMSTLATFVVLPLGIGLGLAAGYFGGWVDDLIQYVYTVISSIPYVLLVAASALMMQLVIEQHAQIFDTAAARADARHGVAVRDHRRDILDHAVPPVARRDAQAARDRLRAGGALLRSIGRAHHAAPHPAERIPHRADHGAGVLGTGARRGGAVLCRCGRGPDLISFGTMINSARGELAQDPVIWWSITAAFVFMVSLVLAANLFADGARGLRCAAPRAAHAVAAWRRRARHERVAAVGNGAVHAHRQRERARCARSTARSFDVSWARPSRCSGNPVAANRSPRCR